HARNIAFAAGFVAFTAPPSAPPGPHTSPARRAPARCAGADCTSRYGRSVREDLFVLRGTAGAWGRAGLDLPAVGRDREVGDCRILRLAGAMRHHRGVARLVRHLDGGEGLGERAGLIYVYQAGGGA